MRDIRPGIWMIIAGIIVIGLALIGIWAVIAPGQQAEDAEGQPEVHGEFAWSGLVQTGYGRNLSNSSVELHVLGESETGEEHEVYNLSTISNTGPANVGWYVFDNLTPFGNLTYGYVVAKAEIGDGCVYFGRTDNVSLRNASTPVRIQSVIVIHIPIPGDNMPFAAPGGSPTATPSPDTPEIITSRLNDPTAYQRKDGSTYERYTYTGSVQDSYGKPYGNATVTLHVLVTDTPGYEYELYNVTATTPSDLPYPGIFGFAVPLYENMTGAYATAEATIQEGVTVNGTSMKDDRPHEKCRCNRGFIVLHVPMPDSVSVAATPQVIGLEGDTMAAVAQLMLNGKPYLRSGIKVNFQTDNDSVGYIQGNRSDNTDDYGRAHVVLVPGNSSGSVNVSAAVPIGQYKVLNGSCMTNVSIAP